MWDQSYGSTVIDSAHEGLQPRTRSDRCRLGEIVPYCGAVALSGGHTDWESGRHYAAGVAGVERSGRDRLRRYAADAEVAEPLRDYDSHHQLPRTQRDDAVGGTGERDAGGYERRAGDGCGYARDFRSGI